jgi:hypothetical protein
MVSSNSLCDCYNKAGKSDNLTNHIVSMKDTKEYLKPNINVFIKWWIPFDLLQLQCRWIEEFTTYKYGNEMY